MEKHLECDEFLEYNTKQELNNDIVFTVKGALDLTQEEAKDLKMSHVFGEQRHQLKSNVKTSKERVLKYFFTIPEHIFNLSNQYIKYNENSQKYSGFFRDAENRDIVAIEKHLKDGIDINTIDSDGRTVFAKYTGSAFDLEKKQCNTEDLKTLLSWGANPAIYGAGFIEEPLENVCLDENVAAVSLLLKSGVNPHSYPCIDEPFEDMSETLLERTERWAVGDPNVDGIPNETQQKILEMLKKYV